jgi:hypothetical protein
VDPCPEGRTGRSGRDAQGGVGRARQSGELPRQRRVSARRR